MTIPNKIKLRVNKPFDDVTVEIEKNQIRRYATSIGETSSIHFDEGAASEAGHKTLVAPLTFPAALIDLQKIFKKLDIDPVAMMHREEEYEYYRPIFAGDQLVLSTTVVNAWEKDVPNGSLMFIAFETLAKDTKAKDVFRARRVLVEFRKD